MWKKLKMVFLDDDERLSLLAFQRRIIPLLLFSFCLLWRISFVRAVLYFIRLLFQERHTNHIKKLTCFTVCKSSD